MTIHYITCSNVIWPPPDISTMAYNEIYYQLQTGDALLFGGTSSGAIIKIFDGAVFSHAGLVSIIYV